MRNDFNKPSEFDRSQEITAEFRPIGKRYSSPMRVMFTAFMAGSLVTGGFMFASDKLDLFGGSANPLVSSVSAAAPVSAGVQSASLTPTSGAGSISGIVAESGPAVVKIETKTKSASNHSNNPLNNSPFFNQFQGGGNGGSSGQQDGSGSLQPNGIGSGFIFDANGYILTNEHVVEGADEIDVYVQGYDQPFKATLLGSSYDLDLAVLQIKGDKPFQALTIGNSDNTPVGDWVVAIGNPYDFDSTVTAGVLSAKERPITIDDPQGTRNYQHLLQTDAAINPGNSGGPLLNMNGEVIGINTAVSTQAQGIGFAIPTSTITSVLDKLINNETIPKAPSPYIGVSLQDITQDLLPDLKLESTNGALVADVQPTSPAFQAGIRPYDVIVAVNGSAISTPDELSKKIQAAKTGEEVTLTISRNGQNQDIRVKVGDKNASAATQK